MNVFWRALWRRAENIMEVPELRRATHRLLSTLAFGGCVAAVVVLVGTRDVEGYDLSFFSLSRGTAVQSVHVLGQPVYTLALGFGVRLPLHGNLGASPAAVLAPYLPYPLTYWLLLALSIGGAALVVRHALEPLIGPIISWVALVLLFCSVPVINYTISNDWPENAVTYSTYVACVFAPHAMLALLASPASSAVRRLAGLAVAGTVWGLMALAHPGHWPLLAASLVLAGALALCRSHHPLRSRLTVVAGLALVSASVVALQAPDILRELQVAGDVSGMRRLVEGPQGRLLSANAFPFGEFGPRSPFSFLLLALVSLLIGATSNDRDLRRLTMGGALSSVLLSVAAATLSPGTSMYAPTITWALRDPAIVFGVFSGACTAAVLRRSRGGVRLLGPGFGLAALAVAGLQGPAYAAGLVLSERGGPSERWNQDMTAPRARAAKRGLAPDRVPPGGRLVFWPAVREAMRHIQAPPTDFADAGYLLVTVWTKDRTMRGLIEEGNDHLFSQFVELPPRVLCDADAVGFLQLRYLLLPPDVNCAPWSRVPNLLVDGWLQVGIATERDSRIRALSIADLRERVAREPALSPRSELMSRLQPLPGTSLRLSSGRVELRLDDPTVATGEALVVPIAYDSAWRTSSGRLRNLGGLVALTDVDQQQVAVEFRPDGVAVLRALSMTLAQILGVLGLLALAHIPWVATENALPPNVERLSRLTPVVWLRQVLRSPRVWLYGVYSVAVIQRLDWRPADSDSLSAPTALLLPITAVLVARIAQRKRIHDLMGGTLLAVALITVAAGGSRAATAPHDPLFWSLIAVVAFAMSAVARRRRALACVASATAGAAIMVATLLPAFPEFESTFPQLSMAAALRTLGILSDQFGVLATTSLLAWWGHAIAVSGRWGSTTRVGAAIGGALVAALMLALAGAIPDTGREAVWIALGILMGLGAAPGTWQAVSAQRKQGSRSEPYVPVGGRRASTSSRP